MRYVNQPRIDRRDLVLGIIVGLAALVLYVRTLAPSVAFLFDDTLEFQYVVPQLGIPHPTGYPLYTLLGKLFTLIVPLNDPAYRLNLFSAFSAALSVTFVYLALRYLVNHRLGAVCGAFILTVGRTFWEQAVVAEIYAMQMLIVALLLLVTLAWGERVKREKTDGRALVYLLALIMGLGLAHHRLTVLLYPAIALYIVVVRRAIVLDWRLWSRAALCFLAPLVLYLYLPLRSGAGSANGLYRNTWEGFWSWVTAQDYAVFLTQDPFKVQHDAIFYWTLFQNQFGIMGMALAGIGLVWLLRRPREWILFVVALGFQGIFVFNYRVADVEVHFLTIFALMAVLAGVGVDGLISVAARSESVTSKLAVGLATVLVLLVPLNLLLTNYANNDLSLKWDVHDYGLGLVSRPFERNATLIGLQGEVTLVRYFQETTGLAPDLKTEAVDDPAARLAAVEQAIASNRVVYLTRPLKGAERNYTLVSAGPLIRVQTQPTPNPIPISNQVGEDLNSAVHLVGYDLDLARLQAQPGNWHLENGRQFQLTLYWQVNEPIKDDVMVSVKLVGHDGHTAGQIDRHPVLDAYPTTAWRAGEVITDTYAVPVFVGAAPGEYNVQVTLYNSPSGTVFGQRNLTRIALPADVVTPSLNARDNWNITHSPDAGFGSFDLEGYGLDVSTPVRPGDTLPLELVWRAYSSPLRDDSVVRIWLEDTQGRTIASRDALIGAAFPMSLWRLNQYVRDWPPIRVPANVADGTYGVKLAVARENQLLGAAGIPLGATIVRLGQVEIKNRPRLLTPPMIPNPLQATFGEQIRLLGYNLEYDAPQRGVRLTLYWKGLALIDTPYTVFVHLVDGKDAVLAAADAVPGNGEFPTTGWLENEYVVDIHSFTLPPDLAEGGYPIEVGLYQAPSGARLKTVDGQDHLIVTSVNP